MAVHASLRRERHETVAGKVHGELIGRAECNRAEPGLHGAIVGDIGGHQRDGAISADGNDAIVDDRGILLAGLRELAGKKIRI